ncbi:hypothetical protein MALG_02571 [Marinovum algicola DG 898]|nr:hypothetical protein MALG_02571 [Marinovum algicola DG 898]
MRLMELKPAERHHVFAGYYDKSPFDAENRRHLALQVDFMDRLPEAEDSAEVGYFDLADGQFQRFDRTSSFNWQQGAMLQWLGPDHGRQVIFNIRDGAEFGARIFDLETGSSRDIPAPVYAVRPQGDIALTVDFARHFWCRRAYAYAGVKDTSRNRPVVPGDGVFLVNLHTGVVDTIVPLERLLAIRPTQTMTGATHYVEHMMFSPSGAKFMFYHRWKLPTGEIFARLYVADIDDPKPKLVLDSGRLSHSCWAGEDRILAWAAPESPLGAFRKSRLVKGALGQVLRPIYRTLISGNPKYGQTALSRKLNGDSYLLIPTDGSGAKAIPVCVNTLDRDGHPTAFERNPGLMITDTYPDTDHKARILLSSILTGQTTELDTLASMPELDNTPIRCDLHPKLSFDETRASVDTVNNGYRSIFVYSLEQKLEALM